MGLASVVRHAAVAALAAGATRAAWRWATSQPPSRQRTWQRSNHRGEPITLLEGPVVIAGCTAAIAANPWLTPAQRAGGLVAVLGAGGFGVLDDLAESGSAKGIRGHLSAARRGQITTGFIKILGIGASGLVAAALSLPGNKKTTIVGRLLDVTTAGATVAAGANMLNLLDLRPGRAGKVVLLQLPGIAHAAGGGLAAAAVGAAAAMLPNDLAEECMLGDGGANALGALLGTAAVSRMDRSRRCALLAILTALTVASEKVSFTKVIQATPGLREIDAWGRRG